MTGIKTRQSEALVRIREMVLRGQLTPGRKLSEPLLAETLGISRTPVRLALRILAEEGLLAESASRGYVVREFAESDVDDALDIRGLLEGFAARRVAQKGASKNLLQKLRGLLEVGDEILKIKHSASLDTAEYADMNAEFHGLVVEESDSPLLSDAISRNNRVPFVHPHAAIVISGEGLTHMYALLNYAHMQHHSIVNALELGDGARAEALMREHVNPARQVKDMTHKTRSVQRVAHAVRGRL